MGPETDAKVAAVVAEFGKIIEIYRGGIKCDITQLKAIPQTLKALALYSNEASAQKVVVVSLGTSSDLNVLRAVVEALHKHRLFAVVEAVSLEEAQIAEKAGADAVIAKGHEAGGRVGEQTTFVLVQQCVRSISIPVWAEGGIGMHTAAACAVAGVTAVVLDSQLYLTPEAGMALSVKQKIATMDGTETTLVGNAASGAYRIYSRHQINQPEVGSTSSASDDKDSAWDNSRMRSWMTEQLVQTAGNKPLDRIYLFGQDIAFASDLTRRFGNVAGIMQAIKDSVESHLELAFEHKPMAAKAPLAVSHGTEFPLVQGAMTRVSDTADFAFKVAEGGGASISRPGSDARVPKSIHCLLPQRSN